MSVKGIFKILIGTIAIIIITSFIVEYFNVTITSIELSQMARIAATQSCELFAQETYKTTDEAKETGATLKTADVRAFDGSLYIKGDFYGSDDLATVYNSLYMSPAFNSFLALDSIKAGQWRSLALMCKAHGISYGGVALDGADDQIAEIYKETYVTPLNIGIPYMDKEVAQKMFRWNLAQLLSNCDRDSIQLDDNGNYCVNYKGFRVYANVSYLDDFDYEVFNLKNPDDRTRFSEITGIKKFSGGGGLNMGSTERMYGSNDERERICVTGINYNVVCSYQGITPIRRIFNTLWTEFDVDGWKGRASRTQMQQWNDATATLKAGGIYGVTRDAALLDVLPVPGRCMYYIVK